MRGGRGQDSRARAQASGETGNSKLNVGYAVKGIDVFLQMTVELSPISKGPDNVFIYIFYPKKNCWICCSSSLYASQSAPYNQKGTSAAVVLLGKEYTGAFT